MNVPICSTEPARPSLRSQNAGHRSIATTARYLDHIAPQQVIETIRRRCWQAD